MTFTRSLWAATAAPGPPLPTLNRDLRAHVTVIGAGFTGLSAALHLSEGGKDVIVLEALDIGERASGLNGGQVIPGLKHDPDVLEAMFGPDLGPRIVQTVASGPDVVFGLIGRHAIDCNANRTGWLQPATSDMALRAIHARVRQWRARGADVDVLGEREMARLTGSLRYVGGWIDRRGGTVQPLSYVRGLARAAQAAGARIFNRTRVTGLERKGTEWCARTSQGSVVSAQVIVATGAYTDSAADSIRRTMIPVPSFQVATEPLPPALRATVLPEGQAASDTWHLLRYFRLDAGGRLVMGSRGAFADKPVAELARHHYRAVREIYPQLVDVRYDYHWGGLVGMTRDHLPHLHELAPGVQAAMGYNGRGVAMATVLGRLMARRILGEPAEALGFPVTPVAPIPFHRFNQLGAKLAIQYFRGLDAFARLRNRLAHASKPAG